MSHGYLKAIFDVLTKHNVPRRFDMVSEPVGGVSVFGFRWIKRKRGPRFRPDLSKWRM